MKRRKLYSTTLYIFDESRARKADSCCHLFKNKKPLHVCLYVITLVCCVTTASHRWDSMTSLASQRPDGNDILSDMVVRITIAVCGNTELCSTTSYTSGWCNEHRKDVIKGAFTPNCPLLVQFSGEHQKWKWWGFSFIHSFTPVCLLWSASVKDVLKWTRVQLHFNH